MKQRGEAWGWLLVVAFACALAVAMLWPRMARAERVQFDCVDIAFIVAAAADFRDAGADRDKTVAILRERHAERTPAQREVIEREVLTMWKVGELRRLATLEVYKRCRSHKGDMGLDG